MPAIEVEDLVVRYGDVVAVDGMSLHADKGSVLAVLGPNGAGKTSTVEALEGYRHPARGHVRVLGLDPRADHAALTRRIGVMLQRGGVYPGMGPGEALRLFASYYSDPEDPAVLLERVGLGAVARTSWRRLSVRLVIRQIVAELRDAGVCVLLTTHELEEAERLVDRIVIVDHGKVVAEGTPAELMRSGAGREIRFGAPPGLDVVSLGTAVGAEVHEERPGEYMVAAQAAPATVAAITAWLAQRDLPLADLRAGRERLEDVFLRLTGTSPASPDEARPRRGRRSRAGR